MGQLWRHPPTATVPTDARSSPSHRNTIPVSLLDAPRVCIASDKDRDASLDERILIGVRHAGTDRLIGIEAHRDVSMGTLKRHLIEEMAMPFPTEDGLCRILMVWNKADAQRDEPIESIKRKYPEINERYLGGSVDQLTLNEFGLDNGDFLLFTVVFAQLFRSSVYSSN